MGTKLGDIIKAEVISLQDLSGKAIAVDAFNTLYQFLSTIRQPDGTPLQDRKGRVTSHLSGLFYRNLNLIENGIRLVYVFDGKSPKLKSAEQDRRRSIRVAAQEEWERALEEGRLEDAQKAARKSSRLTSDMIDESKSLLTAMGIPVIQAPSEGEALAAEMTRKDLVWASASQDNDSLLYNCPRMIRNLSVSGRRKRSRSKSYKIIYPELIDLSINLRLLGITREQLIDIAILIGTDYNNKVPGIGPKTALKLIKQYGNLETIQKEKGIAMDFPLEEIREIFLNPPSIELPHLEWHDPSPDDIRAILCTEHDFSESRITAALDRLGARLEELAESSKQSSLTDFFE
ncbi:MAG: flap endonuclease-1 [Candidatus Thorarchaeota archaeon]|nr:flap endonuclease-1 [Candidatus Thorarchaeota archaeon]